VFVTLNSHSNTPNCVTLSSYVKFNLSNPSSISGKVKLKVIATVGDVASNLKIMVSSGSI